MWHNAWVLGTDPRSSCEHPHFCFLGLDMHKALEWREALVLSAHSSAQGWPRGYGVTLFSAARREQDAVGPHTSFWSDSEAS